MDDRTKTVASVAILIGFFVIVAVVVGIVLSRKRTLSPVPEEGAIKIIFLTPTPIPTVSPTPIASPTPTPKAKR